MAVLVIDTRGEVSLSHTLEVMSSGHSGFSSLRLGVIWSVGSDIRTSHHSLLIQL